MWGPTLKRQLEVLGISQREFAKRLGCREQWISHICGGLKPSRKLRLKIEAEVKKIIKEEGSKGNVYPLSEKGREAKKGVLARVQKESGPDGEGQSGSGATNGGGE